MSLNAARPSSKHLSEQQPAHRMGPAHVNGLTTVDNRSRLRQALTPEALTDIPLFHALAPEHLSTIENLLHPKTLPGAVHLFTLGQHSHAVYLLLHGTVKICFETRPGHDESMLAFYGSGEVLGEGSALGARTHSATIVTVEECRLLWIERDAFRHCLETVPLLGYNLSRILARRLHRSNVHRDAVRTLDTAGRLACQLLEFAQDYGQDTKEGTRIPLRLTQRDLADLIGASREGVSRLLSDYKRNGHVTLDDNRLFVIHDRNALSQQCSQLSC
jgi:CRP/FNR family cyclic AMP-dependent transcriptional regulator